MTVDHNGRVDLLGQWASRESLNSIAPKEEVLAVVKELSFSASNEFWSTQYKNYSTLYDKLDRQVREDDRPISDILGKNATASLLSLVDKADIFDAQSVNVFLKTPAFEEILSNVIYDAIFQFIEKADILGNIINTLPVIGPIRKTINDSLKKSLDQTLGKQIKVFLVDYNRVALQRIIDYISSKENRPKFRKANILLVTSLLSRTANSLLPSIADSGKLKDRIWEFVVNGIGEQETAALLDSLYEAVGEDRVGSFVDFEAVLRQSPSLRRMLEAALARLVASDEGKRLIETV